MSKCARRCSNNGYNTFLELLHRPGFARPMSFAPPQKPKSRKNIGKENKITHGFLTFVARTYHIAP